MDALSLFAPFENQDLCLWFYFLSIIGFVFLVLAVVAAVYALFTQKKSSTVLLFALYGAIPYLIFYFQNRLLYSMCVKSI